MFRDTRRDAAYFADWIACQKKRIAQFSQKLQEIEDKNPKARLSCHLALSGFLGDLISAQYSAGESMEKLRETYTQYLAHIGELEELTYHQALLTLSLGILLDVSPFGIFQRVLYPEDALLDALLNYHRRHSLPHGFKGALLFPETSAVFMAFLLDECQIEDFRLFIRDGWYPANQTESWYESDKREDKTYCGYWCFSGAAIAKMKGRHQEDFQGLRYFPIAMLPVSIAQ